MHLLKESHILIQSLAELLKMQHLLKCGHSCKVACKNLALNNDFVTAFSMSFENISSINFGNLKMIFAFS